MIVKIGEELVTETNIVLDKQKNDFTSLYDSPTARNYDFYNKIMKEKSEMHGREYGKKLL